MTVHVSTSRRGGREPTTAGASDDLLETVLAGVQADPVAVIDLPERPGLTGPWPDWANATVVSAFRATGIGEPWRHQVAAADSAHRGRHTVISTGTASGKSLGYLLPSLSAIADARSGSASSVSGGGHGAADVRASTYLGRSRCTTLYLAPTKALARDQMNHISDLGIAGVIPATYDGDTPLEGRAWVKAHANYVLTNPEMLHRGILPGHRGWRRFLRSLEYVVVDEAHHYRGVFGGHVAAIIRRLRRVCDHHGSDPTFVLASATMADPERTATSLVGRPVHAVTSDSSARGRLRIALMDPNHEGRRRSDEHDETHPDDAEQRDETAFSLTSAALSALTRARARSLGFIRARKGAEAMAGSVHHRVDPDLRSRVTAYRGGLLPQERRQVERDLSDGSLLCVATTNALELGIDICGLDAVVMCGWPGTRASFQQQMGRAGRRGQDSVAVLVAGADPLDRFIVQHWERLLGDPLETSVFNPDNPHVLLPHLAAAVAELPFLDDSPQDWFGSGASDLMRLLLGNGSVRRRAEGLFWTSRQNAHSLADLRGAGDGPVSILEPGTGRVLGTVDVASAPAHVHPGAVYTHLGTTHVVESLDLDERIALARREDVDYTTTAKSTTELRIDRDVASRPLGAGHLTLGDVTVSSQVVAYLKRSSTGRALGQFPLQLPRSSLATRAVWYTIGARALLDAGVATADFPGAVHAAEHAAIGVLPGLATCDRWDLGGLSADVHPQTGEPTVFVYDGHPGGVGIAQHGFDQVETWLEATRRVIASCPCESGCPGCVQSPKCGNGNDPLSKQGALAVLGLLVGLPGDP